MCVCVCVCMCVRVRACVRACMHVWAGVCRPCDETELTATKKSATDGN